jgi:hypothetical protein
MRPRLLVTSLCTTLFLLANSTPARAQGDCTPRKPGEHCYTFDDDLLNSDVGSPNAALLKVRTVLPHTYLLRPRTSFLVELQKSIEQI